jgi:hypothetical protein
MPSPLFALSASRSASLVTALNAATGVILVESGWIIYFEGMLGWSCTVIDHDSQWN